MRRVVAPLVALVLVGCAPPRATTVPVSGTDAASAQVPGLTPDAPFRASPPPPEPVKPWSIPALQTTALPNGMHLVVVERHATKLVAATMLLRGGTAGAAPEAASVVAMAVDVAFHGTAKRSERDVYETINTLFADAGTLATDDAVVFRLRATTASFDAGLALMRDIFVEPAFEPRVVDFERQRRVSLLPKDGDDAYRVAVRMLHVAAYGGAHPYTKGRLSGADALPTVTRDELLRAWKRVVDPSEATLVVAGDVDPTALAVRVGELFAGWKHDPAHAPPADVPPATP
ncbi:MAG TPA: insulinase family protein, partial [Polyangiaceae bacterium]